MAHDMPGSRVLTLTVLAMFAFAANSLLCRVALKTTEIDAASFTSIRLVSGAFALWLIVSLRAGSTPGAGRDWFRGVGNWSSGFALFAYASAFSYAYVSLSVATGALLLFGAVQATMLGYGWWKGERLRALQTFGLFCALAGLTILLLPGLEAPPVASALLMCGAGIAWGVYSLRAKGGADPTSVTAGNFVRAVPFTLALSVLTVPWVVLDPAGVILALVSGALASGVGYAIWYTALPGLRASSAATVQLSVPLIAAAGGTLLLGEPVTLRLVLAAVAILGGIALVISGKEGARQDASASR